MVAIALIAMLLCGACILTIYVLWVLPAFRYVRALETENHRMLEALGTLPSLQAALAEVDRCKVALQAENAARLVALAELAELQKGLGVYDYSI